MAKVQTSEVETAKPRCHWCNLSIPLYVDYHDKEWGVPLHEDNHHIFVPASHRHHQLA